MGVQQQSGPAALAGSPVGGPSLGRVPAWLLILLTLVLVLAGLVAGRPAPARAQDPSAAYQQRLQEVRSAHPDALVATGRGEVVRRAGDDVPALLAAVADPADARTFARGLELLLEAQGQAIGVARPAPERPEDLGGPQFQQTPAPGPAPPPPSAEATEGVSDGGGYYIPFIGEPVVIDDVSGDGLDDVIRWSTDEHGASTIQAVRGLDGSTLWEAPVAAGRSYGVSLQPLGDTTGDGVADLLTSIHLFDEDASHHDCDATGCVGTERFTWLVQLRDGTTGAVVWEQAHEGSSDYEEDYGGIEHRYSFRSTNAVVPYQPLQDVTGDGIGDFLVTLTSESHTSERTIEGQYPGPVTENDSASGTATTTIQIVSGVDAAVVEEITEGETDSVLGGRAVPDTSGDGVSDVLLTRRDLSTYDRTCVTEGTHRTCTEEGRHGGIEVELREAPTLDVRWQVSFGVQEGFASSPGDLTGDGVRDVVVQAYTQIGEGILVVLDGNDGGEAWSAVSRDGYYSGESLLAVTPLGDDQALDLLTVRYLPGEPGQPQLEIIRRDGATGAQLLVTGHGAPTADEEEHYVHSFASGTADADGDGSADVVVVTERYEGPEEYSLTTHVESGRTGEVLATLPQQPAQYHFYMLVGDLDGDGGADAVAFTDAYGSGGGDEEAAPSTTAVRLRDGSVLWQRPAVPNSYTYGAVTAQLDGDAGGDLLVTRERYTDVLYIRQTVAIDGEDGATLWTAPTPPEVHRIAGDDRIATAVALSQATNPSATTVVLARADDFPDALAGGPLASALGAPLLLTGSAGLDPVTAQEIQRLGATQAVLLGGTVALGEQVAADLGALGVAAERLSGGDRYATAAAIADRVAAVTGPLERVAIAAGGQDAPADADGQPTGWVDAILASAYAAGTDVPLLLVRADALPTATIEALQRLAPSESTMLVGAAPAINPATEQEIRDLTGQPTERLSRDTPAQTAVLVATFAIRDGASPRSVWVATSRQFPDALAASAAVGASGGVLLLTDGSDEADAAMMSFLRRYGPAAAEISLVGGTAAIPPGTESRVAEAVSLD